MKIKMHGAYDHFPNHNPLPFEPYIDCYNDWQIKNCIEPNSIALMIEPRSLQPDNYKWLEKNYHKFRYVFTHDSKLLKKCDNAKLIIWGFGNGNYTLFSDKPKTKCISMVCSNKEMCQEHKDRITLARRLNENIPKVDVLGTVDGGKWVDTSQIYPDYKYSIAFENYIDDYWMTEKLFNCFANKTIPIYVGAKKVNEFFNMAGILTFKYWESIPSLIKNVDFEKLYNHPKVQQAIDDNYNRVKQFGTFEDWFFREYGELLDECNV